MKRYLAFFLIFYTIAVFGGIYNLFARLNNNLKISETFPLEISGGVYFSLFYVFILLILSLVMVVVVVRKKFQKIYLVYPIYYLVWYVVWVVLVPLSLSLYYDSTIITLELLDELSKYDFIFYVVDIVFPFYIIIKLYKGKNL